MEQNQTRDFGQHRMQLNHQVGAKANYRNTGAKIEWNRHHSSRPPLVFPHQRGCDLHHSPFEPPRLLISP